MYNHKPALYFDMDGTIVNLYSFPHWLECLQKGIPSPYLYANPLGNMRTLARQLNKLKKMGYKICIVSWGSKQASSEYLTLIETAKKDWLSIHLKSVHFDEICVVPYGTPKSTACSFYDDEAILFDDEARNREEWGENSFSEKEMLEILKILGKSN